MCLQWLRDHSQFIKSPLYISGDSYAGKVVPMVVEEILKGTKVCSLVIGPLSFTIITRDERTCEPAPPGPKSVSILDFGGCRILRPKSAKTHLDLSPSKIKTIWSRSTTYLRPTSTKWIWIRIGSWIRYKFAKLLGVFSVIFVFLFEFTSLGSNFLKT